MRYAEGHSQAFLAARMRGREKHMKDIYEKRQSLNCHATHRVFWFSNQIVYCTICQERRNTALILLKAFSDRNLLAYFKFHIIYKL